MTDRTSARSTSVQEWATALETCRLKPGPTLGYRMANGDWNCAVHIAVSPCLTDEAQTLLAAELQQAINDTVNRVLCLTTIDVTIREVTR